MSRSKILGLLAFAIAVLPVPTKGAWILDATPVVADRSAFQIEFNDLNGDQMLTNVSEITFFSGVTIFTNFRTSVYTVANPLPSGLWIFGTENEGIVVAYASDWSYRITPPPSSLPATSTPTFTATATRSPTTEALTPTSTQILPATATPTSTQILPATATATSTSVIVATPTPTATPPPHDSVVLPPKPKTYIIPAGKASITMKLRVTVVNADILPVPEPGGHTIQLDVTTADCPPGMAGTPDFGSYALGPSNVTTVPAGTRRTALVPLTITSAAFATFNRKAPTRCTLTLAASAGASMDPTPENAVATVEINVIDKNDAEGTVRHETLIKSIAPVRIRLHDNTATKTERTRPAVINADILPAAETSFDTITVVAGDGDCPSGTVGVADYNPLLGGAQNVALLKGGKSQAGSLPLTIHAAAFASPNQKSPARCTAVLVASGPGGDSDSTNNVTSLVIEVIDGNDF